MKKIVLMTLALLCAAQILSAVPARTGKFTRTLPDGRKVTLELHGDEFQHWLTDESGQVVRQDARGFLVPSSRAEAPEMMGGREAVNRDRLQRLERTRRMFRQAAPTRSTSNERHYPMILVQFPDLPFTIADTDELVRQAFDNLANQPGYSANGATGSIRDYFYDNSMGQAEFHFDVFGPVTVSRPYAYYGTDQYCEATGNSSEPAPVALMEAVRQIAATAGEHIFDPYDYDGDGYVDTFFMFYAGFNEAMGGGAETIWPHNWTVYSWDYYQKTSYSSEVFGNVQVNIYSCASEKMGTPASDLGVSGIGVAVHEFSHALGLPDFYDTNFNLYGDGETEGLYTFSPMCSGDINNNCRTPANFTMEERIMLGWAEDFTPMPASGTITIPSVDTNFAYKEETGNPGEYFVFECRSGKGWDAGIPSGMVVYHVDKSDNEVFVTTGPGEGFMTTAANIWSKYSSKINASLAHPCYYTVPAPDPWNFAYSGDYGDIPYPGYRGVTTYQWQGWDPENRQNGMFYDITFNADTGTVTMQRVSANAGFIGVVSNADGVPVAGATVSVYAEYLPEGTLVPVVPVVPVAKAAGGPLKIARRTGLPLRTVETGSGGEYLIDLEGTGLSGVVTLEVSAPGHITRTLHVNLSEKGVTVQNVRLLVIGPTHPSLRKYNDEFIISQIGFNNGPRHMLGALRYSPEELLEHVGKKIMKLDFAYHLRPDMTCSGVQGVFDLGEKRVLVDVPSPVVDAWTRLDISGEDLRIPADKECFFGYALLDCTEGYPHLFSVQEPVSGGVCLATFDGTIPDTPDWMVGDGWGFGPLMIAVTLEDGAVLTFDHIAPPPAGKYSVGDSLDLSLVPVSGDVGPETEISWFLDDEPVSGKPVLSKAGKHLLEARYVNTAGRRKVVEVEITVE